MCSGAKFSNTEQFIQKAKNVHVDNYDYSNVEYKSSRDNVIIICLVHGEFNQKPREHLSGCGCPKCGISSRATKNKRTTESFISKSIEMHGDKYDYSLVDYIEAHKSVDIICNIHGVFSQEANSHLRGLGCPKCVGRNKTTDEIIIEFKNIHGDKYDYSLVDYTKSYNKVNIICKIHGVFSQRYFDHLNGSGCPECKCDKISICVSSNKYEFISKSIEIHGDKYDYSLVDYTKSYNKVNIICKIHGVFSQRADIHLRGGGCQKCNKSKGELKVENFLMNNIINFVPQKRFKDCKNKKQLPFDFYLIDYNICIEYDGEQHYRGFSFSSDKSEETKQAKLEKVQLHDKIKTDYCNQQGIKLIRIPYTEIDNISEILSKELNISLDK